MTNTRAEAIDTPQTLLQRLGGHPAAALGLDPGCGDEAALGAWLVAAALLAERVGEPAARAHFEALRGAQLGAPAALAQAEPERVAALLAGAGHRHAEASAVKLMRVARALETRHAGRLLPLCEQAGGLEELGGALARLAPGFGRSAVHGFLAPLRERFPAAADTPLAPAARSAACCLGWLDADVEEEAARDALRARIAAEGSALRFADLEAALARLGAAACGRKRAARCPLDAACPRRVASPGVPE